MPKLGVLVVEGPHDIEFVYRLVRPFGLERVRMETDLDAGLRPLVPREYPPGGDLQRRMGTPLSCKVLRTRLPFTARSATPG